MERPTRGRGRSIYYVEDMLGTSRVTTTNTGVVCYDPDFYPYGGGKLGDMSNEVGRVKSVFDSCVDTRA